MSATARTPPGLVDPDRLAQLEEERDHLLRSLEDLEREHAAGDLDDRDYDELKDDYTVRTAEVLRAIGEHRDLAERSHPARDPRRAALVVLVVLVLAVGAGILVARSSGQRGAGTVTGNGDSLRERLASCQMLSFQKPKQGITCYAAILQESPRNVEALTYQGWALIRDGQVERGAENLAEVVRIDPDYPDARVFRAVALTRAAASAQRSGDASTTRESFLAAAAEIDRFYRNDPSQTAIQVLQQEGLERTIFFGLLDARTVQCWQQAAAGSGTTSGIDQKFLDRLGGCLDGVLASSPTSTDALLSKALTLLGPDRTDVAAATAETGRILAVDPTNANALLLQASMALAADHLDEASALLDRLEGLPRPTGSFLIGPPEQMRDAIAARRRALAGSTTSAPSSRSATSTVPGSPALPNAGGG
ncbi:MAG: hypothetical protein JST64_01165 [Actinobacteria bacterium]|nr:hypothetical protein [Actinomycetota bacterium]